MERHSDSASSPGFRADPAAPTQAAVPTAPRRNWLHRLVNFAVAIVVLAVAAGTFFLSYPGVHAIARQGGVSGQLARFYPALFDAVLVIACVAAVMLRDARWWARCWAWLVAIVILGAIGTTDVLHAMSYGLRQRPTEGVVAAAPVVAVLLAFSLFLTMLRQSRPQPADAAPSQAPTRGPADGAEPPTAPMMFSNVETIPALAVGATTRPPAPPIALPAVPVEAPTAGLPNDGVDDDVDQAPDATAPVAEAWDATAPVAEVQAAEVQVAEVQVAEVQVAGAPETAPTQEIPRLAADPNDADPIDADQDPGAAAAEGPALAATATAEAEPDLGHPPTEQNEAVRPPRPPAEAGSERAQESTPESTPEPLAETADQSADDVPDEREAQPDRVQAPAPP
jgi:hypothetical protein